MEDNTVSALRSLSDHQVAWFISRCALRALPYLTGVTKVIEAKHYINAFRACSASILCGSSKANKHSTKTINDAIWRITHAAKTSAMEISREPVVAAAIEVTAYSSEGALAYNSYAQDSAVVSDAAQAIYALRDLLKMRHHFHTIDELNISLLSDIKHLTSIRSNVFSRLLNKQQEIQWAPLWYTNIPEEHTRQISQFNKELKKIRLHFFYKIYEEWTRGELNIGLMEKFLLAPDSIIDAGSEAVQTYFTGKLVKISEARVIFLGEGAAGKTSLIRRLLGEEVRGDEKSTPRVEIRQVKEYINDQPYHIHYWDFGGQVIMHATHQFFLREQTINIIVLDIRRGDNLEYWLEHVKVFSKSAPTIVALNKTDQLPIGLRSPPFDQAKIRENYPFVIEILFLSCLTNDGISKLKSTLHNLIQKHPALTGKMPEAWFKVKEKLSKANADYISLDEFNKICEAESARDHNTVLTVLDNLGVAIHFPSLEYDRVVLNPEWITKSIYHIIASCETLNYGGEIDSIDVFNFFKENNTPSVMDIAKCEFLLRLLAQFKLAYKTKTNKSKYWIPMLMPIPQPKGVYVSKHGISFKFCMPFLPQALFFRFVVESGDEVAPGLLWRTGAVFQQSSTKVICETNEFRREITLRANGPEAAEYMTTLRRRLLELISQNYDTLEIKPYAITENGEEIDWGVLIKAAQGKYSHIPNPNGADFDVAKTLKSHLGNKTNFESSLEEELNIIKKSSHVSISIMQINNSVISGSTLNNITNNYREISEIKNNVAELLRHTEQYRGQNDLPDLILKLDKLLDQQKTLQHNNPTNYNERKSLWNKMYNIWKQASEEAERFCSLKDFINTDFHRVVSHIDTIGKILNNLI